MAYAEKRDGKLTGRWFGDVLVGPKGSQQRLRRAFETRKDADFFEVYCRQMGHAPAGFGDEPGAGKTFAEVAELCKAAGGPRKKWHRGRDKAMQQRLEYVTGFLGHHDIAQVKTEQLDALVADLRLKRVGGRPLSDATINRYLDAASAVLTYALKKDHIGKKPEVPKLDEISKERGIFRSPEQEAAVLAAMRAQAHPEAKAKAFVVQVLLESGMRVGELYKLRPDQIENGIIYLENEQTKTDEARTVWIGDELADQLRAYVRQNALPKAFRVLRSFKRAVQTCGFTGNLVLHSARHTRNTRLADAGVDIQVRMQMLGHKTEKTSRRYHHINVDKQLEAAKKVSELRGKPVENEGVVPFAPRKTA